LFGVEKDEGGNITQHYSRLHELTGTVSTDPIDLVGPMQPIDEDGNAFTLSEEVTTDGLDRIYTKYGELTGENNHKSGIVKGLDADHSTGAQLDFAASKARNYKLIVGDGTDLVLSGFTPKTSYIIVNEGNVTISGSADTEADIRAMIIATGNITIANSMKISCFGNVVRTPMTAIKNEAGTVIGWDCGDVEYWTEFEALLNVSVDDSNPALGNTILRTLFDVNSGSLSAGGKKKSGNTTEINAKNWKKN
jgi:hypothetical protein